MSERDKAAGAQCPAGNYFQTALVGVNYNCGWYLRAFCLQGN